MPGGMNDDISRTCKKIVANLIDLKVRIAILDERKALFFVERMLEHQRTGEIYKARVDSVLPGHALSISEPWRRKERFSIS